VVKHVTTDCCKGDECDKMFSRQTQLSMAVMAIMFHTGLQFSDDDEKQSDGNTIANIKSFYDSDPPAQSNLLADPIFNEMLVPLHNSSKRASWDFYAMIKCGTGCNPLAYKGYGCYCGFLGSGDTVDGIDRCCKMHDWCYTTTSCMILQYNLPYFVPYKWKCNGGAPYCVDGNSAHSAGGSCSHQLCECDRQFVQCLSEYPCPKTKAMCQSPWRYFQNLFMGLGTGMEMHSPHQNSIHGRHHHAKSRPSFKYPKPAYRKQRKHLEFG